MKSHRIEAVKMTHALCASLRAHARETSPDECCGVVLGPAGDATLDEVMRFDNLADRYHCVDPMVFPRTARTSYVMDARRVRAAITEGAARGRPVKAIYHSHPNEKAYFSAEDEAIARISDDLLSTLVWIVVGRHGELRAYEYHPADDAFAPRAIALLDATGHDELAVSTEPITPSAHSVWCSRRRGDVTPK